MSEGRRRNLSNVNVWPGYVDALSALLMLVIFMLLIFTLAQVFLALTVSSRDAELLELHSQLEEINIALRLQRETNDEQARKLAAVQSQYNQGLFYQSALKETIAELEQTVATDRQTISLQLSNLAQLQQDIVTMKQLRSRLEAEIVTLVGKLESRDKRIGGLEQDVESQLTRNGALRDSSKVLEARLADQQELTLLAQREVEQKEFRIRDLAAIVEEGKEALEQEKQLSARARFDIKQLGRQIETLKQNLETISRALKLEQRKTAGQEKELADLGHQLNVLLAQRVNKLEQYRSEFFGRLRQVLVNNPNIRVVGDRFVLPSELFFSSASAALGDNGKVELTKLARTLQTIGAKIPDDIDWILRIDGHTDQRPINTPRFPSNWELSTARAVSVVRFLVEQGIPPQRMTAAGFGEYHPVDSGDNELAHQRNRRIELKLTRR